MKSQQRAIALAGEWQYTQEYINKEGPMLGPRPFLRLFHLSPRLIRSLRNPAVLATVFWALVVGLAYAADCVLIRDIPGPTPDDAFGWSIAMVGDINVDSISDMAVGAPGMPGSGFQQPGSAFIVSPSGQFLMELHCEMPSLGDRCGEAVLGVGDWTGDGVPEIAVGAPGSDGATDGTLRDIGRVDIFSGADGTLLRDIPGPLQLSRFGSSLAAQDLDGDGILDLIVGAPGFSRPGEPSVGAVFALSATTGASLIELQGESTGDRFGAAVDVCCDGQTEPYFFVGANHADSLLDPLNPLEDAGAVYVYSAPGAGGTATLLYKWNGDSSSEDMGFDLRAGIRHPGDDGSDVAVIVGSRRYGVPGLPDIGRVSAFSMATGARLWVRDGTVPGGNFGWSVDTIRDITNDGDTDWAGGSPGVDGGAVGLPGQVTISQGGKPDSGQVLCAPTGAQPGELFGFSVAPIGDLDGDGLGEFVVGAPAASRGPMAPTGAVRIYGVAAGPPPGMPRLTGADESSDASSFSVEFDSPATCAALDFAVYLGRSDRRDDSSSEVIFEPELCSTGGANMISVPLPPIAVGTAAFVLITALRGNEEGSFGQVLPMGPEKQPPRITCQVFLNRQLCN